MDEHTNVASPWAAPLARALMVIWRSGGAKIADLLPEVQEFYDLEELGGSDGLRREVEEWLVASGFVSVLPDKDGRNIYYPQGEEKEARKLYATLSGETPCPGCGCTDQWPCEEGCCWESDGRCSACHEREAEGAEEQAD